MTTWTERPLFGGAITCEIPSCWRDVSLIRQVPDHQECFQETEGAILVVEILEQQQNVSDADVASFLFNDLAEANGVSSPQDARFSTQSVAVPNLPHENSKLCGGVGYQKAAMGKDFDAGGNIRTQEIRWIRVELAVFRLPHVQTDLLVTVSIPVANPDEPTSEEAFSDKSRHILSSLKIRDWSLFG
jgi:hypothetical protein